MTNILNQYIKEFSMNPIIVEDYKIDYIKNYYYNKVKHMITWLDNKDDICYLAIGCDLNNNYIYFKSNENKNLYDVRYDRKQDKYEKYNIDNKNYYDCSNYNEFTCDKKLQDILDESSDPRPKRQNTTVSETREPEIFPFDYTYEDLRPKRQSAVNDYNYNDLTPKRQYTVNDYNYNDLTPKRQDTVNNYNYNDLTPKRQDTVNNYDSNTETARLTTPSSQRILRSSSKKSLEKEKESSMLLHSISCKKKNIESKRKIDNNEDNNSYNKNKKMYCPIL